MKKLEKTDEEKRFQILDNFETLGLVLSQLIISAITFVIGGGGLIMCMNVTMTRLVTVREVIGIVIVIAGCIIYFILTIKKSLDWSDDISEFMLKVFKPRL